MSEPRLLTDLRGRRYGEVFVVYLDDAPRVDVYNSFPMNDCPDELWRQLNTDDLARESGAALTILNGPRYWMMDGIGKVNPVEPVLKEFGGIEMRRVATLEIDDSIEQTFYRERHVNRGACWYFNAGAPVFELVAPGGATYVLQSYCVKIDPSLNETSLPDLGERLNFPEGWHFRARELEEELVVDTTTRVATVLQDELQNTYTLVD